MKTDNPQKINTTALAYLGDAVYEQFIREHLIQSGLEDVNRLHRAATGYVKASSQCRIIKSIFPELTETEQLLVKRARNKKPVTKAKNADPLDYRWATALEALVGYLHLAEDQERLMWVIDQAIDIVENRHNEEN